MINISPTCSDAPRLIPAGLQAYEMLLDEILRVPDEDLIPVNLDIMKTVSTVLGVFPKVIRLREHLSELPRFDVGRLDKLESYAFALMHAQAAYRTASRPETTLGHLLRPATDLRNLLVSDANALARRGLLAGATLERLPGPKGALNLAVDLCAVTEILNQRWSTIAGKTAIDQAELVRAQILAEELVVAVGRRERKPSVVAPLLKIRQQVFTLLVSAYDQVRRGVAFLRWDEGDADEIAPSLYGGRRNHRQRAGAPPLPEGAVAAPSPVVAISPPSVSGPILATDAGKAAREKVAPVLPIRAA